MKLNLTKKYFFVENVWGMCVLNAQFLNITSHLVVFLQVTIFLSRKRFFFSFLFCSVNKLLTPNPACSSCNVLLGFCFSELFIFSFLFDFFLFVLFSIFS